MKRTGSLADRLKLRALRSGVVVWGLCERLGLDIAGSTEGPPVTVDRPRREAFDELLAGVRAGDGTIDAGACPYPVHELLTYLVLERGLLLHGSNDVTLDVLESRPAHDFGTELRAVVACDDGIWPLFYAVVARDRTDGVFTACLHVGRPPRLRRFYAFATASDPADAASWTRGAVYGLPRDGFRREWGASGSGPRRRNPCCGCWYDRRTSHCARPSCGRRRSSSGGSSRICARPSARGRRRPRRDAARPDSPVVWTW